jgi:hypothetical protein
LQSTVYQHEKFTRTDDVYTSKLNNTLGKTQYGGLKDVFALKTKLAFIIKTGRLRQKSLQIIITSIIETCMV